MNKQIYSKSAFIKQQYNETSDKIKQQQVTWYHLTFYDIICIVFFQTLELLLCALFIIKNLPIILTLV